MGCCHKKVTYLILYLIFDLSTCVKTSSWLLLDKTQLNFLSKRFSSNPSKASLCYLISFVLQWMPKRRWCTVLNGFAVQGAGEKIDLLAVSLWKFKPVCFTFFYLNYVWSWEAETTNLSFESDPIDKLDCIKSFSSHSRDSVHACGYLTDGATLSRNWEMSYKMKTGLKQW